MELVGDNGFLTLSDSNGTLAVANNVELHIVASVAQKEMIFTGSQTIPCFVCQREHTRNTPTAMTVAQLLDNDLVLVEENAKFYNLTAQKETSVFDLNNEQILRHLKCYESGEQLQNTVGVGVNLCDLQMEPHGEVLPLNPNSPVMNEILGPRRIVNSVQLGHEGEGEGCIVEKWILLQVEFVVNIYHPTEESPMLHTVAQEVWAVPRSDPRLSQGAPLGFDWGAFCQYYDSEYRILSADIRNRASVSRPIRVITVEEVLKLIPSARQQFVQRVLEQTCSSPYDFTSWWSMWSGIEQRLNYLGQQPCRMIPVPIVGCGVPASGLAVMTIFLLTNPVQGLAIEQSVVVRDRSATSTDLDHLPRVLYINSNMSRFCCIGNHVVVPIRSRGTDPSYRRPSMVVQIGRGFDSHLYSLRFKIPTHFMYERFLPMFAGVTLLGGGDFNDLKLPPLLFFTAFSPYNLSIIQSQNDFSPIDSITERRRFFVFNALTELVCDASSLVEDMSLTFCVLGHDSVAVGSPSHNPPFTWLQVSRILSLPFHPPQSFVDLDDSWFNCFIPNSTQFTGQFSKVPSRSKYCYTRKDDFSSYRVVAGLGPVPSLFRAPDDVYLSLDSPKDLGGYLGGIMWYEESATPGVIREATIGDWMYESISTGCLRVSQEDMVKTFVPHIDKETGDVELNGQKWIGIIDVCRGLEHTSFGFQKDSLFRNIIGDDGYPTLSDSNGTPYFEVSCGRLAITDIGRKEGVIMRNCANGKWYWKVYHDKYGRIAQFDTWHESVDGNAEFSYDSLTRRFDIEFQRNFPCMPRVEERWEEAKVKVACLANPWRLNADVTSLICRFLATDPDSDFWVAKELANGFLVHLKCFEECKAVGFFDAAQCGKEAALLPPPEKYIFANSLWPKLFAELYLGPNDPVFSVPHGFVVKSDRNAFCVMFKRDRRTNKIVSGRVLFIDFKF